MCATRDVRNMKKVSPIVFASVLCLCSFQTDSIYILVDKTSVNKNIESATTSKRLSAHKRKTSDEVDKRNVKRSKPNGDMETEELRQAYSELKAQMQSLKDAQAEKTLNKTTHMRKRMQNVSFCIEYLFQFKGFEVFILFQGYYTSQLC